MARLMFLCFTLRPLFNLATSAKRSLVLGAVYSPLYIGRSGAGVFSGFVCVVLCVLVWAVLFLSFVVDALPFMAETIVAKITCGD